MKSLLGWVLLPLLYMYIDDVDITLNMMELVFIHNALALFFFFFLENKGCDVIFQEGAIRISMVACINLAVASRKISPSSWMVVSEEAAYMTQYRSSGCCLHSLCLPSAIRLIKQRLSGRSRNSARMNSNFFPLCLLNFGCENYSRQISYHVLNPH